MRERAKKEEKMKENREKEILSFLEKEGYAKISRISKELFISESTARRNLSELEQKGLINRTHGGAELKKHDSLVLSFAFRSNQNASEKKRIALTALKLIHNGDVVFLDGSSTAFYLAEYLTEFKDVKVITNGIDTLSLLSKNGVTVYSTGGVASRENPSVLVGHYAEQMIQSVHADIFFFSAQSVSPNGDVYDCYEDEISPRKKMMQNTDKSVLLLDSTKTERSSAFRLGNVTEFDYIVCNKDLKDKFDCEDLPEFITFE